MVAASPPVSARYNNNTAKVKEGDTVAVFGLGGIGLAVIQGARQAKAGPHHRRGRNPGNLNWRAAWVRPIRNPEDYDKPIQDAQVDMTDGGVDFHLNVLAMSTMRSALECCHKAGARA